MGSIQSLCSCCGAMLVFIACAGSPAGVLLADEPCKVAPTAKTPAQAVGDATPVFTWRALAGCTNYQLYLASDAAILSVTWVDAKEAGCSSGTGNCTFEFEDLLIEGDYGWWVRGWQPREGTSKWSSGTRFTVDLDVCLQQPQPVAPLDDVYSSAPVYQWLGVYGCDWYQLSASGPEGSVFNEWVNVGEIGCDVGAVCGFSSGVELSAGAYFWWIRGWSRGTGIGRWTKATPFFIGE